MSASPATNRRTAAIVGVLYIIGTLTGVLSVIFTGPILGDPNYLAKVSENQGQLVIAALLVLTMCLSLAMVPVFLFPILKKVNEVVALGYLVFRGALETVAAAATVISWLFLLVISREYAAAGTQAAAGWQGLGAVLLKGGDPLGAVAGIIFCLGALMLYYVFYRSQLIPRWISVWGIVAILLNFSTCILILFGLQSSFSAANSVMNFPILLQEMVMAVWLIVKGFDFAPVMPISMQTAVS